MNWKTCNNWQDLPEGCWLVKIDKERNPYNIAEVEKNKKGDKFIIVGNHFHWDVGEILGYTSFEGFEAE